jgi:prepilin-type N-terminal cleavage/methylation domain-containing protein
MRQLLLTTEFTEDTEDCRCLPLCPLYPLWLKRFVSSSFSRSAFTLIEVIVVLAIVGILIAGVAPAFLSELPQRDPLISSADSVVAVLSRARRTAVESSTPVEVTFDPTGRRWWVRSSIVDTSGALLLANGVVFAGGPSSASPVHVRFDPRGPTTAEPLRLSLGRRAVDVAVDPWTGAMRVTASR